MNKFLVLPCFDQTEEEGYQGTVVSMANASNPSFMLFFPFDPEYAKLINIMLKKEEASKTDLHILSTYQTMVNSWKAGDRYLSGIILDFEYDEESEDEIIAPTLIICDSNGNVDALLKVNFVQSVILAALERKEMIVTDDLLQSLLPDDDDDDDDEDEDDEEKAKFPIDKQILDIAKEIMTGKSKGKDSTDNTDNAESDETKK